MKYYFVSYHYFTLGYGSCFLKIENSKYFSSKIAKEYIEKDLDQKNPRVCIMNYKKISKGEFDLNNK